MKKIPPKTLGEISLLWILNVVEVNQHQQENDLRKVKFDALLNVFLPSQILTHQSMTKGRGSDCPFLPLLEQPSFQEIRKTLLQAILLTEVLGKLVAIISIIKVDPRNPMQQQNTNVEMRVATSFLLATLGSWGSWVMLGGPYGMESLHPSKMKKNIQKYPSQLQPSSSKLIAYRSWWFHGFELQPGKLDRFPATNH